MELQKHITELLMEKLGVDEKLVTTTASFTDDLGADSLDVMELFTTLEKEFGITIPDEDAEKIKTVGSLVNYISGHKQPVNKPQLAAS